MLNAGGDESIAILGLRGLDERIRVAFYGNQHLDTWIKAVSVPVVMEVSSERHAERIRSAITLLFGSERIGQIRDRVRYDTLILAMFACDN